MNQAQIEGFLELTIFSIFTDSNLSLKEGDALNEVIASIEWQSRHPQSIFLLTAMSRARTASSNEIAGEQYLRERAALFTSKNDQESLLHSLKTVLGSDDLVEAEYNFLEKIQASLPTVV